MIMKLNKTACGALLGAFGLIMTSCGTSREATTPADLSGEWNVVSVNGNKITLTEGAEQPYFGFDTANGRVFGSAGCNRIMGSFDAAKAAEGELNLGNMAATRMMCPDMTTEQSILQACGEVSSFKTAKNGDIELCNADGKTVMTLARREAEVSVKSLDGKWKIVEVDGTEVKNDGEEEIAIEFDPANNSFSCQTGCNLVNGSYSGNYINVKFEPGMMTRMACPDTTVEDGLVKVLPQITFLGQLASGNIGFYNAANDLVLIIAK